MSWKSTTRSGYTYAAYHRGKNRHEPTEFTFVCKTLSKAAGTNGHKRVRNVYRHPVTRKLYVVDRGGYFVFADIA